MLDAAIAIIGVGMAVYHLASTQYLFYSPMLHRNTHLGFALVLVFLATLRKKSRAWPILVLLILLSVISVGYVAYNFKALEAAIGMPTTADLVIGIILVVIAFEATRQAYGWVLPILGAVFVAYIVFGQYLPGPLWHGPYQLREMVSAFSIGFNGVYGFVLGISARYIYLFVLFGALLGVAGATGFFMEVGKLAGRRFAGGGGITAVISSALVGSATGSVAANVTITGGFTIPTMKRMGYTPEQAGAIEAVASTGGQIMPPVMGAVAFIMADFIGISYWQIVVMAIIPAMLYFLCCGLFVQFTAAKRGLRPEMEKVDKERLIIGAPLFLIPLATLVYLLAIGFSAQYAAFWAIVSLVTLALILGIIKRGTLKSLGTWVREIARASVTASQIAVSIALIGVVISSIEMTGIGLRFPAMIETLSGGNVAIVYLLTAVAAITLGMGVPTVAAYTLVALLVAPIFYRLGLSLPQAHFFVLFFAVFSFITPPMAPAALIASGIAGGSYLKTAIEAVKVGAIAFLLPFMVIWNPALLLQPNDLASAVTVIVAALAAILMLQASLVGYYLTVLNLGERVISAATAVLLIAHIATGSYLLFFIGFAICLLLTLWQWRRKARGRLPLLVMEPSLLGEQAIDNDKVPAKSK